MDFIEIQASQLLILVLMNYILWTLIKITIKQNGYKTRWFINEIRDVKTLVLLKQTTANQTLKYYCTLLLISESILFLTLMAAAIVHIAQ